MLVFIAYFGKILTRHISLKRKKGCHLISFLSLFWRVVASFMDSRNFSKLKVYVQDFHESTVMICTFLIISALGMVLPLQMRLIAVEVR